jgi:hypothetical protein
MAEADQVETDCRYRQAFLVLTFAAVLNVETCAQTDPSLQHQMHQMEIMLYARCFQQAGEDRYFDPFSGANVTMDDVILDINPIDVNYRLKLAEMHNFVLKIADEVCAHELYQAGRVPIFYVNDRIRIPSLLDYPVVGCPSETRELWCVMKNYFMKLMDNPATVHSGESCAQLFQGLVDATTDVEVEAVVNVTALKYVSSSDFMTHPRIQYVGCKEFLDLFSVSSDLELAVNLLSLRQGMLHTKAARFCFLMRSIELYRRCFASGRRQRLEIAKVFFDDNVWTKLHVSLLSFRNGVFRHSPRSFVPLPASLTTTSNVQLSLFEFTDEVLRKIHSLFAQVWQHVQSRMPAALENIPKSTIENTSLLVEFKQAMLNGDRFAYLLPTSDRGQGIVVRPVNDRITSLLNFEEVIEEEDDDATSWTCIFDD